MPPLLLVCEAPSHFDGRAPNRPPRFHCCLYPSKPCPGVAMHDQKIALGLHGLQAHRGLGLMIVCHSSAQHVHNFLLNIMIIPCTYVRAILPNISSLFIRSFLEGPPYPNSRRGHTQNTRLRRTTGAAVAVPVYCFAG